MVSATRLASTIARADRCWSSPAARARQTAECLGLAALTDPALRACDHGCWTGSSLEDIHARAGEASVLAWLSDPAAAPHGGESTLDVLRRVATWLDARSREDGHGVAVTHPEVARAAILHAIQAPAASFARIDLGPLTRVVLSCNRVWRLRAIIPATGIS